MKWRRLREPSVFWLPYFFSSPGDCTTLTRDQFASSSSATAIGRLVREPVPISARCATIVTSPLGIDRDEDMRVADHSSGHLGRAGGVGGEGAAGRDEFGGDDQAAGGDQAPQEPAAAHILDGGVDACRVDGCHVTLLWRPP